MKTDKVEIAEYQLEDLKQQSRFLSQLYAEGVVELQGLGIDRATLLDSTGSARHLLN